MRLLRVKIPNEGMSGHRYWENGAAGQVIRTNLTVNLPIVYDDVVVA